MTDLLNKTLGPVTLDIAQNADGTLSLSAVISEAQLLALGIKLLPASVQPIADDVAAVVEGVVEKL
jgi:hypothetical protein